MDIVILKKLSSMLEQKGLNQTLSELEETKNENVQNSKLYRTLQDCMSRVNSARIISNIEKLIKDPNEIEKYVVKKKEEKSSKEKELVSYEKKLEEYEENNEEYNTRLELYETIDRDYFKMSQLEKYQNQEQYQEEYLEYFISRGKELYTNADKWNKYKEILKNLLENEDNDRNSILKDYLSFIEEMESYYKQVSVEEIELNKKGQKDIIIEIGRKTLGEEKDINTKLYSTHDISYEIESNILGRKKRSFKPRN